MFGVRVSPHPSPHGGMVVILTYALLAMLCRQSPVFPAPRLSVGFSAHAGKTSLTAHAAYGFTHGTGLCLKDILSLRRVDPLGAGRRPRLESFSPPGYLRHAPPYPRSHRSVGSKHLKTWPLWNEQASQHAIPQIGMTCSLAFFCSYGFDG